MNARHAIPAALLVTGALCAAPAGAATYCAHQATGCPPGSVDVGTNLEDALDSAENSGVDDVLLIGPGTWVGPLSYNAASGLDIVGAGPGQTTVTALAGAADQVLYSGRANVSGLRVRIPASKSWTGLVANQSGVVSDVVVDRAPGAATGVIGVHLFGTASLERATVTLPTESDSAVRTTGEGVKSIAESALTARIGIDARENINGVTTVSRSTVDGINPVLAAGTRASLGSSVLRSLPGGEPPIVLTCTNNRDGALSADHVTLVGDAPVALKSECLHNQTTSAALTNSISTLPNGFIRKGFAGGEADVGIVYSDLHIGSSPSSGPGTANTAQLIDADPQFAPGTLQPQAGSPVIDAGAPGAAAQPFDLLGAPRIIGERQDMGAFEFDPAAPPDAAPGGGDAPAPDGPAAGGPAAGGPGAGAGAGGEATNDGNVELLAGLRATLRQKARRRGATYRHRFVVPGKLTIRWLKGDRIVARGSLGRSTTGNAALRMRLTKRGKRVLRRGRRVRLSVRGSFTPTGQTAVAASRRVVLKKVR